jgi:hypothetical protein
MREKRVEEEQLILRKEHMQIPGKGATWNSLGAITSARLPFEGKSDGRGQIPHLPNASNPHLEIISGELSNLLCAARGGGALVYLKVIHTHKPLNGDGK